MLSYLHTPQRSNMPLSSSPLNPLRSSSPGHNPLSSPTPAAAAHSTPRPVPFAIPFTPTYAPPSQHSLLPRQGGLAPATPGPSRRTPSHSSPGPLSTRYTRPAPGGRRTPRAIAAGSSPHAVPDIFSDGATPTESAMWRERLARRMADRERRKRTRETDLARRRGIPPATADDAMDDDAAEQQAQADDEDMFRRLMVLQRRREQHAALAAEERETGGYDPNLPDFWADELDALDHEERALWNHLGSQDAAWATEAALAAEAEQAELAALGEQDALDEFAREEELWTLEAAAAAEQVERAEREHAMLAAASAQRPPAAPFHAQLPNGTMPPHGAEDEAMDVE